VGERSRGRDTGLSLSLSYLGELFGPLAGGLLADYFFIEAPFLTAAVILLTMSFFLRARGLKRINRATLKLSSFSWFGPIRLFWSHRALKGMGILGMVMHATNPAMRVFLPLLIVERLGMSYKAIGLAMFFYGINHLWQGFFGAWGDRIGHSRVVLAGTGVYALCFIGIFFAPDYFWLLALLFVLGCGGSLWNVGAWSLMSEIGEREKIEAQVLTSYMSIAQIGSLISFLLSAWVVSIWGFSFIFLANGIVILAGMVVAFTYFQSARK
jgi:MFS family permease